MKQKSDSLDQTALPLSDNSKKFTSQAKEEVIAAIEEVRQLCPEDFKSADWFFQRYIDYHDFNNDQWADKTIIATNCIYVPEELIYAAGAIPLRICNGFFTYEQAGSSFLHTKSCPLVRATVGKLHLNYFPFGAKPKLVVLPTSCDQKKKITELNFQHHLPYYLFEVPSVKNSPAAKKYFIDSILDFKYKLEHISGQKITSDKLKKSIYKIYQAQSEFRHFIQFRKNTNMIFGNLALIILNAYFFSEVEEWTGHLKKLNNEIEQKLAINKQTKYKHLPRLIITGSPSIFPNIKVPLLAEKSGAIIVADDFCSSTRMLNDTVAPDEWGIYDLIPALADRYLNPCSCPNITPNSDRFRKLLEMFKDYQADGIIYQTFAGCHLFDMESIKIIRDLQQENIPVLAIETTYGNDDIGQLSTRIEAFIESLFNRKKE